MADTLDMTLDDIIKNNKKGNSSSGGGGRRREGRRGSAAGGSGAAAAAAGGVGPNRRAFKRSGNRAAPYQPPKAPESAWQHDMYSDASARGGGGRVSALETGTKLFITNLDFGVSTEDVKELFSELGDLKKCSIHYDPSGRSKGTAEVIFARRGDAVAAMKKYNNVQLDGKPMKIEILGTNTPTAPAALPTNNGSYARNVAKSAPRGVSASYKNPRVATATATPAPSLQSLPLLLHSLSLSLDHPVAAAAMSSVAEDVEYGRQDDEDDQAAARVLPVPRPTNTLPWDLLPNICGFLDDQNQSLLHQAAGSGEANAHQLVAQTLIAAASHGSRFIDEQDKEGYSPLHLAASWDNRIVKILLENGADASLTTNTGMTALHFAARNGEYQSVEALAKHGADVNQKDESGRTSLHMAVDVGDIDMCGCLLEYGAHIDAVDNDGKSPLLHAVESNKRSVAVYLARHGADVKLKDYKGKSPYRRASKPLKTALLDLDGDEKSALYV